MKTTIGLSVMTLCFSSTSVFSQTIPQSERKTKRLSYDDQGSSNKKSDISRSSSSNGEAMFLSRPSPFPNTTTNSMPLGAEMNRTNSLTFGASLQMSSVDGVEKSNSRKIKLSGGFNQTNLFVVYPTSIGLRLGAGYQQDSTNLKISTNISDNSLKGKLDVTSIGISGAFVLPNGFGAAITLTNNTESQSGNEYVKDEDVQYGHVNPQFMLVKDFGEVVLTWDRSVRHETNLRPGYYRIGFEGNSENFHPIAIVERTKHSDNDDDEHDSFTIKAGGRFMLDEISNLRVLVELAEAYYDDRSAAEIDNVGSVGFELLGEQLFEKNHILSYGLGYKMQSGKGKIGDESSSISLSTMSYLVGYRFKI